MATVTIARVRSPLLTNTEDVFWRRRGEGGKRRGAGGMGGVGRAAALGGKREGAKAGSTQRCSQAVPHPGTSRALHRLTSEVRRDLVHSTRYGRQQKHLRAVFISPAKPPHAVSLARRHVGRATALPLPGACDHTARSCECEALGGILPNDTGRMYHCGGGVWR